MQLDGYVKHVIYRNAENGYTVFQLETADDEHILTGTFQFMEVGERVIAEGEFVDHPSYGVQFKVAAYEMKPPEDMEEIRQYLASGAIKGIGAALAERILKKFGADTMRIMEEEPERLAEVKESAKEKPVKSERRRKPKKKSGMP